MSVFLVAALLASAGIRDGAELRDVGIRPPLAAATAPSGTVTIEPLPYERTVVCSEFGGIIFVTATGSGSVTWSSSPTGDSGTCSLYAPDSYSCDLTVSPSAPGSGVETITVSQGAASDSVVMGFYVAGSHSCFLSQDIDGDYNSSLSDLDAVADWYNSGTSNLNVTQGTGSAQPTFRTAVVGGQPVVRCDGGDRLAASTASDWIFLNDASAFTSETVAVTASSNPNALVAIATTTTSVAAGASRGFATFVDDRASVPANNRAWTSSSSGGGLIYSLQSADDAITLGLFNLTHATLDTARTPDAEQWCNGSACGTVTTAGAGSGSAPGGALTLCAETDAGVPLTGDLFRVLIYESALTATQRAINQAVDEWALGQALPVVAPTIHLDSSYLASVTTAGGSVSDWRSTGILTASVTAAGAAQPTHSGSGSTAQVDFDGTSDGMSFSITGFSPTASSWHAIAVVTPEAVTTNGTGASCYLNDAAVLDGGGGYRGILFRDDGVNAYAIAYNYDSNADCAEAAITLGDTIVIDASLSGGNVRLGIDGGALTSVASGNTGSIQNTGWVGWDGASRFMDGQIHELLWFPSALSSDARTDVIADLKTKWGIP